MESYNNSELLDITITNIEKMCQRRKIIKNFTKDQKTNFIGSQ